MLKERIYKIKSHFRNYYYFNDSYFHYATERLYIRLHRKPKSLKTKFFNFLVSKYGKKQLRRHNAAEIPMQNVSAPQAGVSTRNLLSEYKKLLQNADAVSFDIFDTLLYRKISVPTDVFSVIEHTQNAPGFKDERIAAEMRARNLFGAEITIDEIYDVISPKFAELKKEELELESRMLYRNDLVYSFYKEAIQAGKPVVAISDMYLHSDYLKKILRREGYTELAEVFVSGELQKSKAHKGELFELAAKKLHVRSSKMLHAGDSRHSDYNMARERGFNALCIPTKFDLFLQEPNARFLAPMQYQLAQSIHNSLVAQQSDFGGSYYRKLGFMLGGPLALSYMLWLRNELMSIGEQKRPEAVLFIARDGWLLRQLFERHLNDAKFKTGYLYFNRIVGLKAFCDYLDEPHYLEIILEHASREIGTPKPVKSFEKNLEIFKVHKEQLYKWGSNLRNELLKHAEAEAQGTKRIVTVDLGSGRFASLRFAQKCFGKRLINSYFLMTVNDYTNRLVYQPFMRRVATTNDVIIPAPNTVKGRINVMELIEILISSPEPRVLGVKDGKAVFDGHNDEKTFYTDIAQGIEDYFKLFIHDFGMNPKLTMNLEDWIAYSASFIAKMNDEDFENLGKLSFSPAADNASSNHCPFAKKD